MRDSTNRGWDEQFVDAAWGEMQQLLKKELPVSTGTGKRRGALLLILFFFLGLIAGGLSIYMTNSPMIEYFPIPQRAVALQTEQNQSDPPIHQTVDVLLPKTQETKIKPSLEAKGNKREANTAFFEVEKQETKISDPAFSVADGNTEKTNRPVVEDFSLTTPEIITTTSPLEEKLAIEHDQPIIATGLSSEQDILAIGELLSLPLNDLENRLMSSELDPQSLVMPPMLASTSPTRLDWGAELGGNYLDGPGYFVGMLVDYRLHNRWRLQSGLHYGQMVSGLANISQAVEEAKVAAPVQRDPVTGLANNADQQGERSSAAIEYYNINIQLQQLSSPVQLTYLLSDKWQLGAGVQVHYLLAGKRPVQNSAADNANSSGLSFSTYDLQITGVAASDKSIDAQLFKRWNMGATVGAAFRPADRWSFQLRYQYGLFNWLEADRFLLTPTNVQLSAVYRLSKG